jgi:hypothetical protein
MENPKACVCLLASQVTSQPSFTPRALDFTLESLASQVLAVNNTNRPTTSHFFLNPVSSIPQLLASHHFAERTRQERSTSPPRHCTTTPTRHMPHGKQVGRQADSFSHFHPSFIHHPPPVHSSSLLSTSASASRCGGSCLLRTVRHFTICGSTFLTIHISHRAPTAREPPAHQLIKTCKSHKTRVRSLAQITY